VEVDQFGREVFTMHEWGSVVKRFYGNPELAEQPGVFDQAFAWFRLTAHLAPWI
jgi:hypothetical protein